MSDRSRIATLPLYGLRAFEAAARLGSFKAAAAELFVTPAAISHQVKALENALGLALFERLHRSLRLTHAGEQLGKTARESFQMLEAALGRLSDQGKLAGPTTLNVSAAPSIAVRWLAPRLHKFHALHPHVDLRLQADDRRVDLVREAGTDVAVRYGAGPYDRALEAVRLWKPGRMIVVCAPALVAEGALTDPQDVLRFVLLRTAHPSVPPSDEATVAAATLDWPAWLKAAGVDATPAKGPYFGSTQLTVEAAIAGRGLALAPEILVRDDLRSGRLASPFDVSLPDPFSYWLLFRRDRADEVRVRTFRTWLLDEIAQEPS